MVRICGEVAPQRQEVLCGVNLLRQESLQSSSRTRDGHASSVRVAVVCDVHVGDSTVEAILADSAIISSQWAPVFSPP